MTNTKTNANLRGFYVFLAIVALAGLAVVGYQVVARGGGSAAAEPVDLGGTTDARELMNIAVPMEMGEAEAPVTVIVFEDYLCGACAFFSLQVKPRLDNIYFKSGQARLVFYDYPLNPTLGSFLAARAARCAGDQGRFWEYHNTLMANQATWGAESDKAASFLEYARGVGLDQDQFRGCLNSDRHAREVTASMELAHTLALPGTPSVLVGTSGGMSRRLPQFTYEAVAEAIDDLLGVGG